MKQEYLSGLDAPRQQAISELTELVRRQYPLASFVVVPSEEDPALTHLIATVDVDDPDEVTDLTIERELSFLEQGVPVAVIPLRTPERTAAVRRRNEREQLPRPRPMQTRTRHHVS